MWGNYALSLYRVLARRWSYALISGLGLALGMTVFTILTLVVRFETSFDRWVPHADRIYRVQLIQSPPGQVAREQPDSQAPLLPNLLADFQQIQAGSRLMETQAILRQGASATYETVQLADESFFQVFALPLAAGDRASALTDPSSLVISQQAARKYFGTDRVLGRDLTLAIDGVAQPHRITGVLRDLPPNSHLKIDFLLRFTPQVAPQHADYMNSWSSSFLDTYVRLASPRDAEVIQAALPAFASRRVGNDTPQPFARFRFILRPLTQLHFLPSGADDDRPSVDPIFVGGLGAIGLAALAIAIVNYVSLATAYAGVRGREVALRKVVGATRRELLTQFVGEAVAMALAAALVAAALSELVAPAVSAMLGEPIRLRYFGPEGLALPFLGLALLVGAAAGIYPALVLSRFEPASVLAATRTPGGGRRGARLRSGLAVGQFAAAIGLMICTMVIFAQMEFLRRADLGFRRDGLVIVQLTAEQIRKDQTALMDAFRRLPGALVVSASTRRPATDRTNSTEVYRIDSPQKKPNVVVEWIAPDYAQTYGLKLLAGRLLGSDQRMDDSSQLDSDDLTHRQANIMINRSAATALGFNDPAQAVGKLISFDTRSGRPFYLTIVGVTSDVRFLSPHHAAMNQIYLEDSKLHHEKEAWNAAIRVRPGDEVAMLARVAATWRAMEPGTPLRAQTAPQALQPYYDPDARRGQLFAAGSAVAGIIACLGLYGLAAFNTGRRFKEIGVRKTLGASTADVLRLLVGEFLRPVLWANLIAWPLAFYVMRAWLAGFDQRVTLTLLDFLLPALAALAVAVVTVAEQSWRVARAEPSKALRYE